MATVVWAGVSVAGGARLTDQATVGQFVLAIVTLTATMWSTRHAFSGRPDTATHRTPRLTVDLGTRKGCLTLREFLNRHDSHCVFVSMSCPYYHVGGGFPEDRWSVCHQISNWSKESPTAWQIWTRTNCSPGFPLFDADEARAVMQVIVPKAPKGSTEAFASNNGDLSNGVGGLTIKGYFLVSMGGTGSLGPPGVVVADLIPVMPQPG